MDDEKSLLGKFKGKEQYLKDIVKDKTKRKNKVQKEEKKSELGKMIKVESNREKAFNQMSHEEKYKFTYGSDEEKKKISEKWGL